jgi:hypothetical protein
MFTRLDQPRWLQRCASECRRVATYLILLCLTTLFAAAQTTLTLSSGLGNAATTVNLNLAYSSGPAATAVSAIQWTFAYSAVDVTSITVNPGTEATAAQKNILCSAGTGTYTCLALGLANQNTIQDGTLAVVQIGLAANPSSSVPVHLSNEIASDPNGNSVPISGTPGSISVQSPGPPGSIPGSAPGSAPGSNPGSTSGPPPGLAAPALTGISCVPSFLIEPGASTCTVSLSGPAPPNLQLVASSSSPAISVSPLIAVPAGATTTLFTVAGNPANKDRSGTVTITLGPSTTSIPFNLLPPLSTTGFQVINQNTGTCLTALTFAWQGSPLGVAIQQACSSAPNQIVSLSPVGAGYTLGFKEGLLLNAAGSSFGWAFIMLSPLSSGTGHTWQLVPAAAGTFLLFSTENQECLEVPDNSKTNFLPVQQSACSVSANQRWSLVPVGQ